MSDQYTKKQCANTKSFWICNSKGIEIGMMCDEPDADNFLAAVNSHDTLVGALRNTLLYIDTVNASYIRKGIRNQETIDDVDSKFLAKARAALAAAEGQQK